MKKPVARRLLYLLGGIALLFIPFPYLEVQFIIICLYIIFCVFYETGRAKGKP